MLDVNHVGEDGVELALRADHVGHDAVALLKQCAELATADVLGDVVEGPVEIADDFELVGVVGVDGGGERCRVVLHDQRRAVLGDDRQGTVLVGVGVDVHQGAQLPDQQVAAVDVVLGGLAGGIAGGDADVHLGDGIQGGIDFIEGGSDPVVDALRQALQPADSLLALLLQALGKAEKLLALGEALGIGGQVAEAAEQVVEGVADAAAGERIEDRLHLAEDVVRHFEVAELAGFRHDLGFEERVAHGLDTDYLGATADRPDRRGGGHCRRLEGVLSGVALGADVGDVVSGDLQGYPCRIEAADPGIESPDASLRCENQSAHLVAPSNLSACAGGRSSRRRSCYLLSSILRNGSTRRTSPSRL